MFLKNEKKTTASNPKREAKKKKRLKKNLRK